MIGETDTLALAAGVSVEGGRLADDVRGASWPLNESGSYVLSRTGLPVGRIVNDTAAAFSVPHETARDDVLRFAWSLNALALVNVEHDASRVTQFLDWVRLAVRLAPAGAWPAAVTRRHAVDTASLRRSLVDVCVAIVPRAFLLAVVVAASAVQLSMLGGSPIVVESLALGLGAGLGITLHEAAHAASLRRVPSALVLRGRRTFVLHSPVNAARRSLVAIAGPLAPVVLGSCLVVLGIATTAPASAIVGCSLAAHALALTVVGGDGRVACGL